MIDLSYLDNRLEQVLESGNRPVLGFVTFEAFIVDDALLVPFPS